MDERTRGALLALLASAEADLATIRQLIAADDPVQEPPVLRDASEPCEHPAGKRKVLSSMGGGGTTLMCVQCGEIVE